MSTLITKITTSSMLILLHHLDQNCAAPRAETSGSKGGSWPDVTPGDRNLEVSMELGKQAKPDTKPPASPSKGERRLRSCLHNFSDSLSLKFHFIFSLQNAFSGSIQTFSRLAIKTSWKSMNGARLQRHGGRKKMKKGRSKRERESKVDGEAERKH